MVSYGLVVGLQTCWFIVMLGYSLAQLRFVGLPFCSMLAIRTVDMSTTVLLLKYYCGTVNSVEPVTVRSESEVCSGRLLGDHFRL